MEEKSKNISNAINERFKDNLVIVGGLTTFVGLDVNELISAYKELGFSNWTCYESKKA